MAARLRRVHQQSKQVPRLHRRPAWSRDYWSVATAKTPSESFFSCSTMSRSLLTPQIPVLKRKIWTMVPRAASKNDLTVPGFNIELRILYEDSAFRELTSVNPCYGLKVSSIRFLVSKELQQKSRFGKTRGLGQSPRRHPARPGIIQCSPNIHTT